jgi:glutamate formiminotransferase/formiminotetrahydrofolate cyclodeaminase
MQVSINITDIKSSPLHMVFRSCIERAIKYNTYVEGCELIGLIPESSLIETGIFINSNNVKPTDQLIDLAIKWLALSNVKPFDPNEHILRGV